MTSYFHNGALF